MEEKSFTLTNNNEEKWKKTTKKDYTNITRLK